MNDLKIPAYSDTQLAELSPAKLADILIEDHDRVPRNVIDACASRGDAMAEYLRQLHEDDLLWNENDDDPEDIATGKWWLRLHAAMILGSIPGEQAGLLLVDLMRRMSQEEDEYLQDWLAGYWAALFRNKPDTALAALRALCEDKKLDWYIRASAIEAVISSAAKRDAASLTQALAWLAGIVADDDEDWNLRLSAGNTLLDYQCAEYRPLLENMADKQHGSVKHFDRDDIQKAYSETTPKPDRFTDPWKFYEPDAIVLRQIRWKEEAEQEAQRAMSEESGYLASQHDYEPYVRPESKIGRNDPCPCGSGKKYKQCCLKTEQAQPEDDFLWRRVRRAIEGSPARLLSFGSTHFGQEALLEAWDEFMPPWANGEIEPFTPDTPHMQIFMPWFFFDWLPDPKNPCIKPEARDGRTLARAFLDKKGRNLDPLYARYIEQCCAAPFSFYEVWDVRPGTGFTLRDLFTGEEVIVTEHSGSQQTQIGDILFAKLAIIDQIALLEANSPVRIPPIEKGPILDLRKKILRRNPSPTAEALKEYFHDMLGIYHDITDRLLNPPMPQLQNTDGEPMVFNKLIYDLQCTPREAFDALKQLNITGDDESILADAAFGPTGELVKIAFAWEKPGNKMHTEWNNTVLGHIDIDGKKLTAEVNSENRAQRFKTLMEKLLPGKARYKTTVIQSPQSMLARMKEEGDSPQAKQRQQEQDELNNHPEVQAKIAEYLCQHYRDWLNEKIPVLKNKTPLQAVKTKDGKEMVEALLMDIEQRSTHSGQPLPEGLIEELRERLGL